MPKAKGMTSIEIAIIVAIILVIAVAVGWYLYTTFTASTGAQSRLSVASAVFNTTAKPENSEVNLKIIVSNPGPVEVSVQSVYLAGTPCSANGFGLPYKIPVGSVVTLNMTCSGVSAVPGTMLQGQVITTAGTNFPFTASVR